MNRSIDPVRSRRTRALASATMLAVGLASAGAARAITTPFVPIARDAHMKVVTLPPMQGSTTPIFLSAGLILPRETTRELADYVHTAGAPAAAAWLCEAYTAAPAASLRGVIRTAAAGGLGGEHAADAFVCPRIREHVRETVCVKPGGLYGCRKHRRIVSHELSYPTCTATDEQRAAFDVATCSRVLLGRSGRAFALQRYADAAALSGRCLEVGVSGGDQLSALLGEGKHHARLDFPPCE